MEEKKKFAMALPKEACPLCGALIDGPILIKTRAVNESNNEFEDNLNGKTIGYKKTPCEECQDHMKKGFLLIGIIESKSNIPNDLYRSGNIWVLTNQAAERMFSKDFRKKGAAFIDAQEAVKLHLPDANVNA